MRLEFFATGFHMFHVGMSLSHTQIMETFLIFLKDPSNVQFIEYETH